MTREEIIYTIDQHLRVSGKRSYSDFYVGITNDVNRRLFHEHNVNRETMWWIYCPANTKEIAQEVEQYYLRCGMQGNAGGGTDDSLYVYCYAIGVTTYDH